MHTLTVTDVAVIARTAKSTKERTRAEAWTILKACDRRLKQATEGELALAPEVRLPLPAVISLLWTIRKAALAQWKAAKAAEATAQVAAAEDAFLADYRAAEGLELAEVA